MKMDNNSDIEDDNNVGAVYLKEWGLSESTINNFEENRITFKLFDCIQESEIKELIPNIRERILFKRGLDKLQNIIHSTTSLEDADQEHKTDRNDLSLCSLYKESQNTVEDISDVGQGSFQDSRANQAKKSGDSYQQKNDPKAFDFSKYVSSTWKGMSGINSSKSSKSVTFTAQDAALEPTEDHAATTDPSGLLIDPPLTTDKEVDDHKIRSMSTKLQWPLRHGMLTSSVDSSDDDLWLAFLFDTGLLKFSEINIQPSEPSGATPRHDTRVDDPDYIMKQLEFYHKIPTQTYTTNITDDYEDIHRKSPGLFWDTVTMDDPDEAFNKVKRIIRDIVNSQPKIKPMFDIDFTKLGKYYPTIQKKMDALCNQITPQRFYF